MILDNVNKEIKDLGNKKKVKKIRGGGMGVLFSIYISRMSGYPLDESEKNGNLKTKITTKTVYFSKCQCRSISNDID